MGTDSLLQELIPNPFAHRTAKILWSFDRSESIMINEKAQRTSGELFPLKDYPFTITAIRDLQLMMIASSFL